jgi:hypothetical protein
VLTLALAGSNQHPKRHPATNSAYRTAEGAISLALRAITIPEIGVKNDSKAYPEMPEGNI